MRECKTDGDEGRLVVKNQIFLSTPIGCRSFDWLCRRGLGVILVAVWLAANHTGSKTVFRQERWWQHNGDDVRQ